MGVGVIGLLGLELDAQWCKADSIQFHLKSFAVPFA